MGESEDVLSVFRHSEATEGSPGRMGVTWLEEAQAYNFALFSRHATAVTLLFYREANPVTPVCEYQFNRFINKTGPIWHCRLPLAGLHGATLYAYRVDGPRDRNAGHRFDPEKILVDPYAPAIDFPPNYSRRACGRAGRSDGRAPLGVLPMRDKWTDWEDVAVPFHNHDAVIYELHVKGFTARANSGVSPGRRGTFAGLIEKLPYLQDLGVTIVELMPIHQYDPQEGNYWGYMTLNFFSPHRDYAVGEPFAEFRNLVRAMHAAGIEVWLDVVYNHTSEGSEAGPTYSYRGIDNSSYYVLAQDRRRYYDETGTGNMLKSAQPAARSLVVNSMRFWQKRMHVDGFRFDLASALCRGEDGKLIDSDPPLIAEISSFGSNTGVRLVAEAWDIGAYQLGRGFPGVTWLQWNGQYRDDLRSFVKGDPGKVGALMVRLYGSDDLFPDTLYDAMRPYQSVNFITTHDGFCLYDLVAYNQKHNVANGHNNTDGSNNNLSWNCGWEGDRGAPPEVLALRRRQVRNFICLLMLSNGTPMFCAGDEFLNTQGGNNNPYNQDNLTTWLDWDLLAANRDVYRFFKGMIAFRKAHPSIGRSRYWREDVQWYGVTGAVDLGAASHSLAYCLHGASEGDTDLYVMINAWSQDLTFAIQEGTAAMWRRAVDTGLASPSDIMDPGQAPRLRSLRYPVKARSVVVLIRDQG
jgi:isoamylase